MRRDPAPQSQQGTAGTRAADGIRARDTADGDGADTARWHAVRSDGVRCTVSTTSTAAVRSAPAVLRVQLHVHERARCANAAVRCGSQSVAGGWVDDARRQSRLRCRGRQLQPTAVLQLHVGSTLDERPRAHALRRGRCVPRAARARAHHAENGGVTEEVHMALENLAKKYPRNIGLTGGGDKVQVRFMGPPDRDAILRFARNLPEEDLLFLRTDITNPETVDEWIANIERGLSATLVAYSGDTL